MCPTLDDLLGDLVLALSSLSSSFFACLGRPVPPAAAGAAQSRTFGDDGEVEVEVADAVEEMQVLEAKVFSFAFFSFAFLSFAFLCFF